MAPLKPSTATHSGWLWLQVKTRSCTFMSYVLYFKPAYKAALKGSAFTQIKKQNCFSGVLCTIIGILVVTLNFMIPEKMKEAFSVGVDSYEDEDVSYGEGYLNSVFLDGVTISPVTLKATVVSW